MQGIGIRETVTSGVSRHEEIAHRMNQARRLGNALPQRREPSVGQAVVVLAEIPHRMGGARP